MQIRSTFACTNPLNLMHSSGAQMSVSLWWIRVQIESMPHKCTNQSATTNRVKKKEKEKKNPSHPVTTPPFQSNSSANSVQFHSLPPPAPRIFLKPSWAFIFVVKLNTVNEFVRIPKNKKRRTRYIC